MNARKIFMLLSLLTIALVVVSACAAQRPRRLRPRPHQPNNLLRKPNPPHRPSLKKPPLLMWRKGRTGLEVQASPYQQNRMIIKNGEMTLLVTDTDRAIDQATGVAVDSGGYIVSSKTWLQDGFKYAALTMGIPLINLRWRSAACAAWRGKCRTTSPPART